MFVLTALSDFKKGSRESIILYNNCWLVHYLTPETCTGVSHNLFFNQFFNLLGQSVTRVVTIVFSSQSKQPLWVAFRTSAWLHDLSTTNLKIHYWLHNTIFCHDYCCKIRQLLGARQRHCMMLLEARCGHQDAQLSPSGRKISSFAIRP